MNTLLNATRENQRNIMAESITDSLPSQIHRFAKKIATKHTESRNGFRPDLTLNLDLVDKLSFSKSYSE